MALCNAIGDAQTRPARKQKPGKRAVCYLQLQSKQDLVMDVVALLAHVMDDCETWPEFWEEQRSTSSE